MERTRIGRLVEVKVSAEHFIGSFAAQHHLDAHALDDACQKIHRRRGAHGGYVVGLDEINHIAHGVQPLLNGVVDFVVHGADVVCHLACLRQVGRTFQPTANECS